MTHTIRWSRVGWAVVTTIGGMVIATIVADTFADAVLALAVLVGA